MDISSGEEERNDGYLQQDRIYEVTGSRAMESLDEKKKHLLVR